MGSLVEELTEPLLFAPISLNISLSPVSFHINEKKFGTAMLASKDISNYNLHLDRSCVFLPLEHHNEQPPCVTGRLTLSLIRPASLKGITVRVIGKMKTPQYGLFLGGTREQVTFERSQTVASSKIRNLFTMPEGDYEFPFEIPLSGILYDTLTGPKHEYHAYRVEVLIERWMWPNLVVSRPLRIHRYPMINIGLGLSKVAAKSCSNHDLGYHFSIPDTLVPHGSAFPVECWFRLSQGVVMWGLTVRVIERHELCFNATATEAAQYGTNFITSHTSQVLLEQRYDGRESCLIPREVDVQQISIPVRLPAGEGVCSQSYSSRNIQIEHVLVIEAEFGNRESESNTRITETIPLYIYMRPEDTKDHIPQRLHKLEADEEDRPPPTYERHQLDRIISVAVDASNSDERSNTDIVRPESADMPGKL
ncbi:hypothetical protein BDV10DRAFT_183694 [Aspergillus recurvatus]